MAGSLKLLAPTCTVSATTGTTVHRPHLLGQVRKTFLLNVSPSRNVSSVKWVRQDERTSRNGEFLGCFSNGGDSNSTHHHISEPGSINSSLIESMKNKIRDELNAELVTVKDAYGDGRHVSIDVIASTFEGQSAVKRQRLVYKAIWEELQTTVHAVDQMTTRTPSEAQGQSQITES